MKKPRPVGRVPATDAGDWYRHLLPDIPFENPIAHPIALIEKF
jgi:hypothetical protein